MYVNDLEKFVGKVDINSSKLTNGKDSVSVIDAIATVNKSGEKWAISLVNRHPSKKVDFKLRSKITC